MKTREDLRGFTLIEVMVALTVLTIGVLGMAALTVSIAQANRGAVNRTRADQVVHEKLAELQGSKWEPLSSGQDTVEVGQVEFVRDWTVTKDEPRKNVKKIEITASWIESGDTYTARSASLVGRY